MTRPEPDAASARLRLDRWLWQARFFKTRGIARAAISAGRVRVNGRHVTKPGAAVAPGDVLTFVQGGAARVVRIRALGLRRGPATEARGLYEDLVAPATAAGALGESAAPPLD